MKARYSAHLAVAALLLGSTAFTGPEHIGGPSEAVPVSTTATKPRAVVDLSNVPRALKGCEPLKVSKRLTQAAQRHADDMSRKNYFSHTSKDGRTWIDRIRATGWKKPAGENIAYGYSAAAAVLTGWMDSPGHRRNILDCNFKYIGVGFAVNGNYWVQDFGY